MPRVLEGRTIALAEGRQLEELAQLLEKEGAKPLRCPMVSILDAPEVAPVIAWLRKLIAGEIALVVLMTGEGLRRLLGFAEREGLREEVIQALGGIRTMTRGPKPVRALKEVGLSPTVVAEVPTTAGIISKLRSESLPGQGIGVQLYGGPNPELTGFLESAGAKVHVVIPYIYAPAADAEAVVDLIHQLANGAVDAVVFTSSPQLDRLYEVAAAKSLQAELAEGLKRTKVAAIGPVVADRLRRPRPPGGHLSGTGVCDEEFGAVHEEGDGCIKFMLRVLLLPCDLAHTAIAYKHYRIG